MDLSKVNTNLFSHLDLSKPRWSQETYSGRAKHFFTVTNPLNVLLTNKQLDEAKALVMAVKNGNSVPPNTTEDEIWKAKYRYDSAFHPDTKEKMLLPGRMSAQVPMNMTITGCMLTFYKTTPQVILWQWLNQTFNATVNYTNRSGDADISKPRLFTSYICATSGAVGTAIYLNSIAKKLPSLVGRFVPFAAVASANCVNIPLMRSSELTDGITVTTSTGERVGESKKAARKAIFQVTMSRIGMALSAMSIAPVIMNKLVKGSFLKKYPYMNAPIQIGLVGLCLSFATPLCCALFPQQSSMSVSKLEPELQETIKNKGDDITIIYFNKGL